VVGGWLFVLGPRDLGDGCVFGGCGVFGGWCGAGERMEPPTLVAAREAWFGGCGIGGRPLRPRLGRGHLPRPPPADRGEGRA